MAVFKVEHPDFVERKLEVQTGFLLTRLLINGERINVKGSDVMDDSGNVRRVKLSMPKVVIDGQATKPIGFSSKYDLWIGLIGMALVIFLGGGLVTGLLPSLIYAMVLSNALASVESIVKREFR